MANLITKRQGKGKNKIMKLIKKSFTYFLFLDFFKCLGLLLPDLVSEGVLLLLLFLIIFLQNSNIIRVYIFKQFN